MQNKNELKDIKNNFDIDFINSYFDKLKKLKVLIIGDTIIDQYVFVRPKGRAIKDPILSVEYLRHETYAGGVLAVANHISTFVKNLNVVTLIGDNRTKLDIIKDSLETNAEIKYFTKKGSPTTIKKRYVDHYRNTKLFKTEYINDSPISPDLTKEIVGYLSNEIQNYDLIVVTDFGHGFINDEIRRILEEKSKYLAINVQSNSANMGYNYINHYKKVDFVTMNEEEVRLPLMMRFDKIEDVMAKFSDKFRFDNFLVTVGKNGSILFDKGKLYKFPVVIDTVVDTVGAGDALFAIASLLTYVQADNELIPFIANCAGGIKANYMGNKESVTKQKLISFLEDFYNAME